MVDIVVERGLGSTRDGCASYHKVNRSEVVGRSRGRDSTTKCQLKNFHENSPSPPPPDKRTIKIQKNLKSINRLFSSTNITRRLWHLKVTYPESSITYIIGRPFSSRNDDVARNYTDETWNRSDQLRIVSFHWSVYVTTSIIPCNRFHVSIVRINTVNDRE